MKNHSLKFKIIFTLIFLAGVFVVPKISWAADFYIAQNQAGSNDGSNCSNAKAVSWFNTAGNWVNPKSSGKIGPGDTVHLCGTITASELTFQGSGSAGLPITIIFETGAKIQPPAYCGAYGCINMENKSYLIVDGGTECGYVNRVNTTCNGSISNPDSGYPWYSRGVSGSNCKNCKVKNLEIGPYLGYGVNNNGGNPTGYYWKVHNNYVHGIGTGIVYMATNTNDDGYEVYNNWTYDNSHDIDTVSNGDYQTGNISKALIHDNHVTKTANYDAEGCPFHQDGIYSWCIPGSNHVYISGLQIYNNLVDGDWGACPSSMIWTEGNTQGSITNVKIYNNILAPSNYQAMYNGLMGVDGYGSMEVYNNTIIGLGSSNPSTCFVSGSGSFGTVSLTFKNNLIVGCTTPVAIYGAGTYAITLTAWDYNIYASDSGNPWTDQGIPAWYSTFSAWKSRCTTLGDPVCDSHSLYGNTAAYAKLNSDGSLQSDSPAKDAGISLSSIFTTDRWGTSRPQGSAWDMGAYEYVGAAPPDTTPPAAPSGVVVL